MFKKLALVAVLAVTCCSAPAFAMDPATMMMVQMGAGLMKSMMHQRPHHPRRPPYAYGEQRRYSNYRSSERRVAVKSLGVGANEFPVEGIPKGIRFAGVSNPSAATRCYEGGGKLVATSPEQMPNGQIRYRNQCVPR